MLQVTLAQKTYLNLVHIHTLLPSKMTLLTEKYSQNLVILFYFILFGGNTQDSKPWRQHLSSSEKTAPKRQQGKSGCIQVCNKGSRESEHQRSGVKLRNVAFYVWEDASLWTHWIQCFHMQLSYLGQPWFPVHLKERQTAAACIPQLLSNHHEGWQHPLDQFWEPSFTAGDQKSLMAVTFLVY